MKLHLKRGSIFLITVGFILFIYAFIEPYWIQYKKTEIASNEIPSSFIGKKLVFVTDIHHTKNYSKERVGKLVDKINALKPDIILLGGDYVNISPEYIIPCFEELGKLQAPMGKFGVLGNHDHWESAELTRESMKKAGIECLDNKSEWIHINGERIKIGGVGDLWCDKQVLENTVNDVKKEDFVVLLSHNPDFAEQLTDNRVDLMLSGHTHGGQVTLFGLWAPFIPSNYGQKYRTGMVKTQYTNVLVSHGTGNVGVYPVRFFARPQINIIELK